MTKNLKIKESLQKTRLKRSSQKCLVFKFKINESKLSKKQKEELKMMFVEGKWLYNYIISNLQNKDFQLSKFNPLISEVKHYDKDKNEVISQLNYLPSSCKQTILAQIHSSLKIMKTLRSKGFQKHGKLKFISELKSLEFKQYGRTHDLRSSTKMKIQGISKLVKVAGIQQLNKFKELDFANAKLLNTPSGYYIALTCYIDKSNIKPIANKNNEIIGLDFGCQTSITTSNGHKINISFEEGEQLKKLQRQLARKGKTYSNRRNKLIMKIRKQYQHITNKKLDTANKFVHQMKKYKKVVIQDEQLSKWQKTGHGKKIQHSCLGKIKAKLKQLDNVIVLDRYIPTTKLCSHCGTLNSEITLHDRTFKCPNCDRSQSDRDIHAAQNMVWIYENLVGRDAAEFTLKEFKAAIDAYQFDNVNKPMNDDLRRCSVFS